MNGKVTINDVAQLANVSPSTVSNLLNGRSKRMSAETELVVWSAIEQLGYRPNQAARQLKTGHAKVLGLVVPSVANPFYGVLARHVEKAALEQGYQLFLCNSERDPKRELMYAEELWGYGVRGLILGSSLTQFSHLDKLVSQGLNLVAFDRVTQDEDSTVVDSIGVDNVLAGRLATKHLLSLGHTRIGFLSGSISTVSRIDRFNGYLHALEEAGIEKDDSLIWHGYEGNFGDTNTVEMGRQGTQELMTRLHPPTAIFAINDMYAFGSYAGAHDLGMSIPDDLSVVGMDDITLAEVIQPPLTTIKQPIKQMAQVAAERLIGRLQQTFTEKQEHTVLAPRLVVRSSTITFRE